MRATSGKSGAQVLRERLKKPEILVAPGAYDCLSARLVERMGFEAAFMTGFGASASILGQPDYGLMTMNEMATVCANMNAVLNIPLIGDIDTGYGNPLNGSAPCASLSAPVWLLSIWRIRCSPSVAAIWRKRP